jgi:hypothetical protein
MLDNPVVKTTRIAPNHTNLNIIVQFGLHLCKCVCI